MHARIYAKQLAKQLTACMHFGTLAWWKQARPVCMIVSSMICSRMVAFMFAFKKSIQKINALQAKHLVPRLFLPTVRR